MTRATKFFKAIAWKRLRVIDLPGHGSNQHELQGITALRLILGTADRKGVRALWRGFDDDGLLVADTTSQLTWYDARAGKTDRSAEFRLYFRNDTPLEYAKVDDLLLIAQPHADGPLAAHDIVFYVIPWESSLRAEVMAALQLDDPVHAVKTVDEKVLATAELLGLQEETLRALEPAFQQLAEPDDVEAAVREHFREILASRSTASYPKTIELATFAQSIVRCDPREDPDDALMRVLDLESRAFHALENLLLAERISKPFPSVAAYLKAANSDLNRRKSRRGSSFEHQLAWIFTAWELPYEKQAKADGGSKVDFLFPGIEAYDKLPPQAGAGCGVVMLALKSKVRERWGQLSRETRRLVSKHLATLDPHISASQLAEMKAAGVEIVVPARLHAGYGASANSILSVRDFVELVRREVR
jgi:EcoRII C terminal